MCGAASRATAFCLLALIVSAGHAQSPFHIDTAPVSTTRFELLPQAVKQMCKKALGLQDGTPRVYAHASSKEYEYYAIFDESMKDDEYYGGSVLEIHGTTCRGMDLEGLLGTRVPRNGYHGASPEVRLLGSDGPLEGTLPNRVWVFRSRGEEKLFREFVRDAIRRDVIAHGGDKPFRSQACKPSDEAQLLQAVYPIVLQELKAYCASSPGDSKP